MGAEALRKLLKEIDLDKLSENLKKEIEKEIKTNSNTKLIVESVKNILLDMK